MKNYLIYYLKQNIIILSDITLTALVEGFWTDILSSIDPNQKFRIQVQFKSGTSYRSLTYFQILDCTIESKNKFLSVILKSLQRHNDRYNAIEVNELYIRYKFIDDGNVPITINEDFKETVPVDHIKMEDIELNIPLSSDPSDWTDDLIVRSESIKQFYKDGLIYTFTREGNTSNVEISTSTLDKILKFKDIIDGDNPKSFTRVFNKDSRYYIESKLIHRWDNDTKFISRIAKTKEVTFNVITMDLETRLNNDNLMEVVSISSYSPCIEGEYFTYYLSDYKNAAEMLVKSILDLTKPTFDGFHVYLHNFSKFDGIFLLKALSQSVDSNNIKLLIRDRDLLNVTITFKYIKVVDGEAVKILGKIHFHDSLLLLPNSLSKLAKNFGVIDKGTFDLNKLNDTPLDKLDSIRTELLTYNKRDCLVLYEILNKFNLEIFNLFKLNITNYPSLSSLAFANYRSNFLKKGGRYSN